MKRRWIVISLNFVGALVFGQASAQQHGAPMPPFEELYKMPAVYSVPGEEQAEVKRDIVYKSVAAANGDATLRLKLDVYTPRGTKDGDRFPAVVLISGGGAENARHDFRDAGVYLSYGRMLAASGFAAITFSKRYVPGPDGISHGAEDQADLIRYVREHASELHVDAGRLAFWAFSAGGSLLAPILAESPNYARALLCFYCVLDADVSRLPEDAKEHARDAISSLWQIQSKAQAFPPMFIGRAGLDYDFIRNAMDRFIETALAKNLAVEVMNQPHGRHAFDVIDPEPRSREIIQRALEFLRAHLSRD